MPLDSFKVEIQGLRELQNEFSQNGLSKKVSFGLGLATKSLHSELRFAVKSRYAISGDLNSVLKGSRFTSTTKFGNSIFENGLEYRYRPIDLSKFPYTKEWGNLLYPKPRQGWVHTVTVVRGRPRVSYGKSNHGGFTKLNKKHPQYGMQMLERKGKSKYPVRLLFGPSLSEMAYAQLNNNSFVQKRLNDLERYIADQF
jgi:hypothetical protein